MMRRVLRLDSHWQWMQNISVPHDVNSVPLCQILVFDCSLALEDFVRLVWFSNGFHRKSFVCRCHRLSGEKLSRVFIQNIFPQENHSIWLTLTWAIFDPKMDIEFNITCAMDTDGLYNGGVLGPYQSFAFSSYSVENILVWMLCDLFGKPIELFLTSHTIRITLKNCIICFWFSSFYMLKIREYKKKW